MRPSDFDLLAKRLHGYRVRRDERAWVVTRMTMPREGRLTIDIAGSATRTLSIDLPVEFKADDNEHVAWLLGWIEHTLLTAS